MGNISMYNNHYRAGDRKYNIIAYYIECLRHALGYISCYVPYESFNSLLHLETSLFTKYIFAYIMHACATVLHGA